MRDNHKIERSNAINNARGDSEPKFEREARRRRPTNNTLNLPHTCSFIPLEKTNNRSNAHMDRVNFKIRLKFRLAELRTGYLLCNIHKKRNAVMKLIFDE